MKILRSLLFIIPLIALATTGLLAQGTTTDAVKKRMKSNLPVIEKMKKAAKVGETNKGYLRARVKLTEPEAKLVKTENADRKLIYQLLAKRANATLAKIENARAEQIRKRSALGLWLQAPNGQWYQKIKADR